VLWFAPSGPVLPIGARIFLTSAQLSFVSVDRRGAEWKDRDLIRREFLRRGRVPLLLVVLSLVTVDARAQTSVFTTGTPEELARATSIGIAHLTGWAKQRGISDELKVTRVHVDATKMAHVRVQQFHRGVPVFGGEAIAHLSPTGEPAGQTDNLVPKIVVNPMPRLTADAAAADAIAASCPDCTRQSADLWIVRTDGVDHLAFRVQLRQARAGAGPSLPVIFLDAHDGSVLMRYDNLQTAPR
jgi:Zn-dependent metalloprotease